MLRNHRRIPKVLIRMGSLVFQSPDIDARDDGNDDPG
jgi:hypothetical protein